MTVINLGSMTAVMDQPAKSAKLGLPGNADQVALAISIALGRVRFTVQNKRRLQTQCRPPNSELDTEMHRRPRGNHFTCHSLPLPTVA